VRSTKKKNWRGTLDLEKLYARKKGILLRNMGRGIQRGNTHQPTQTHKTKEEIEGELLREVRGSDIFGDWPEK